MTTNVILMILCIGIDIASDKIQSQGLRKFTVWITSSCILALALKIIKIANQ